MRKLTGSFPDIMPVLSPGRHRNPKRGACFMEFASYLAGEHWSDHPKCTHPVLAELARTVNDLATDATRARMGTHIPRVIGLTSADPELTIRIAARAAAAALPIASFDRQRPLALGLLICQSLTTDPSISRMVVSALSSTPDSALWAARFMHAHPSTGSHFESGGADAIVRLSAVGIAHACVPDPGERLLAMFTDALDDAESFLRRAETDPVGASVDQAGADHAERAERVAAPVS